ncbi:MAG: His/Gly/Thr/Pro-type tRNA ligase C-terminal domain-containing protein [Candidatus Methanoperedens sp.]|nr:His/Gly/Thr/Pro-type tRNA ligase C-terminal domain-containing protein [Candidatus Methanoperedens sp.]
MSYANTIGASHVVIVGKNELDAGKVALKDMRTGEQELVTVEEAVERVKS